MAINRKMKGQLTWAAVGVLAAVFLPASVNPAVWVSKLMGPKKAA